MKWANHKLVTTVVVFAGTGNFLYAKTNCGMDGRRSGGLAGAPNGSGFSV